MRGAAVSSSVKPPRADRRSLAVNELCACKIPTPFFTYSFPHCFPTANVTFHLLPPPHLSHTYRRAGERVRFGVEEKGDVFELRDRRPLIPTRVPRRQRVQRRGRGLLEKVRMETYTYGRGFFCVCVCVFRYVALLVLFRLFVWCFCFMPPVCACASQCRITYRHEKQVHRPASHTDARLAGWIGTTPHGPAK